MHVTDVGKLPPTVRRSIKKHNFGLPGRPVPLASSVSHRCAACTHHLRPVRGDAPTTAAMSEMIQQAMEGMVPELEEYIRATLFTKVRLPLPPSAADAPSLAK